MRSAREVHRDAFIQRGAHGFTRPARRAIRSFDERLRPREAESSLFIGGERSAREPIDVVRSVDEQQVVE